MTQVPLVRDGQRGDIEAMGWARSDEQAQQWRHQLARASTGEVDFLVVQAGDRVVGKAVLDWTHNPDGTPWLWLGSVDPAYRSKGIGALGLAEAETRARDRGHVAIEMCVDDDNPRAQQLYLRSGYVVVGPHLDEHDETLPDGSTVHVASPGVRLRKDLR